MKRVIIVGNWKMNHTIKEAKEFATKFEEYAKIKANKNFIIGVCPSFLSLDTVNSIGKDFLVASQNCYFKPSGAFTGEVSIPMLQELNIKYSLVGHSERRAYFNETNETCNLKLRALFDNGMNAIYCVGETLDEYEASSTKDVIYTQLKEGLVNITKEEVSNMVIAYEPVWSIGTGKNASTEIAQNICHFIRETIKGLYDEETSKKVLIQYGGSVKENNVAEYMACEDINGALVGGASLDADKFIALIEQVK